jgi:hypothetical protein
MELRQGSGSHWRVHPIPFLPPGDALLHNGADQFPASRQRQSRTEFRSASDEVRLPSLRFVPAEVVSREISADRRVPVATSSRHAVCKPRPYPPGLSERFADRGPDRQRPLVDCWPDGAAGGWNSTRPTATALAEGDHRRSHRHVGTRPCWCARDAMQAPVNRGSPMS